MKAGPKFLGDLAGVTDPEKKRKIIGRDFVEVFNEEAMQIKDVRWLAQGTIYPDVIESCSVNGLRRRSSRTTMWGGCRRR